MSQGYQWVNSVFRQMSTTNVSAKNPALTTDEASEARRLAGRVLDETGFGFDEIEERVAFINAFCHHQAGLKMARDICVEIDKVNTQLAEAEATLEDLSLPAHTVQIARMSVFHVSWQGAGSRAKNLVDRYKRGIAEYERERAQRTLIALPAEFEGSLFLPPDILEALQAARAAGDNITLAVTGEFMQRALGQNGVAGDNTTQEKPKKHRHPRRNREPNANAQPVLSADEIRAGHITALLQLQTAATEEEARFALETAADRGGLQALDENIEFLPLLLAESREKLELFDLEIKELKQQQAALIGALAETKAKPIVITEDSLVIAQALADQPPSASIANPRAPDRAPEIQTRDLQTFENSDDARITEIIADVKKAREQARIQQQNLLNAQAFSGPKKALVAAYEALVNKADAACDTGEQKIRQYTVDNARLLAQLSQVNPSHALVSFSADTGAPAQDLALTA